MPRTFRSAIGWVMIIPLLTLLGVMGLVVFLQPKEWKALLILLPLILFIGHLLVTTNYTIDNGQLRIRCGFFRYAPIEISSITRITETRNPLSSPALSLDRLEIRHGLQSQVMISPKDKEAFIASVREINPAVECR